MFNDQKNNFFIPASIILAGFVIAGGIYLSNKGNGPSTVEINDEKNSDVVINQISSVDHILGDPNAPVVLVEFSDTECPYCKMFQTNMNKVMDTYGKEGKIAWVYRHFPLDSIHPKARKEAEATECVNELGGNTAFWKMIDTIYENTPGNNGLDAAKLPEFAKIAGVDIAKFNACLSSGKYADTIENDFQDGIKAGAQGTPYIVMVLKNSISSDMKSSLDSYILKNKLFYQDGSPVLKFSSSGKEITASGALPVEVLKGIIDILSK